MIAWATDSNTNPSYSMTRNTDMALGGSPGPDINMASSGSLVHKHVIGDNRWHPSLVSPWPQMTAQGSHINLSSSTCLHSTQTSSHSLPSLYNMFCLSHLSITYTHSPVAWDRCLNVFQPPQITGLLLKLQKWFQFTKHLFFFLIQGSELCIVLISVVHAMITYIYRLSKWYHLPYK